MRFPIQITGWGTSRVRVQTRSPFDRKPNGVALSRHILYTRGDELIEPTAYRGAFEQALARSLVQTGDVGDDAAGRAYAAAMTGYACVEYKAKTVAGVPLEILNGVKGADETPLDNTPLDHFLSISAKLLADWQRSQDIWGRTYLRKRYNTRGYPTGLTWLNPLDVYEYTDRGVVTGYRWQNPAGGSEQMSLQEVIYTQAFDARSLGNGLSKFEAAWLALNIDANLSTYAAAFFLNGAQIDGFLSFEDELTDEQYTKAREDWRRAFQGARNAHRTAVMPGGAKWNPVSSAPKDLAMTELKGAEREDVCTVFDVDPVLVHLKDTGDPLSASSTYSAIEISHIRNVTLPFLRSVVLPALNDQWAMKDFGAPYRIDIDDQSIPALQDAQLVRADTANSLATGHVLDYPEARELLGYGERADYIKRAPDEPLALWQQGGITRGELRALVSGQRDDSPNNDVVLVGGQIIPASRLLEVANANADKLIAPPAPSPFGNLPGGSPGGGLSITPEPPPQLPSPSTQAVPVERVDDHSLCAMLYFQPNDPALVGLQNRLRQMHPEGDWTAPDEFHVTVFYAPDATDAQAARFSAVLAGMTPPELSLTVGSLHSFDNVGEHALHFRIKRNADLLDYQEQVFDEAQEIGILASPFSAPDSYIPHVTMGYLKERSSRVTYSGRVSVRPVVLRLMYGETCVHERPLLVDQPARRSETLPLQLAVDLSGNQFVRYARRILSDALTVQGINAVWVDEDAWRVVLAQSDEWTPAALSALIKRADYADVSKVDARINGYTYHEGGLYAVIDAAPVTLMKGAALDLRAAELEPGDTPSGQYLLLGMTDTDVTEFPPVDFPIVLSSVGCYIGDERYHEWSLRSASHAELKELTNWERVVTRKGRDYEFHVETLPDGLRDYVRSRLMSDDPIDAVFADAKDKLIRADIPAPFVTPQQYTAYWGQYDGLMQEIGAEWLNQYSAEAWKRIKALGDQITPEAVDRILSEMSDDLVQNWVGSSDKPGALTRLVLAGMAAGDQALQQGTNPKPTRAIIEVDWNLLSQEALDYARKYAYDLIKGINKTTTDSIRTAIAEWVKLGAAQSELTKTLSGIVQDPNRAALIAQTESTRVYNEGARKRWSAAGITRVRWQTVRDANVCPVCGGLHNREGALNEGVFSTREQAYLTPPAHPGCRCFTKPVISASTQDAIDAEAADLLAQMSNL